MPTTPCALVGAATAELVALLLRPDFASATRW